MCSGSATNHPARTVTAGPIATAHCLPQALTGKLGGAVKLSDVLHSDKLELSRSFCSGANSSGRMFLKSQHRENAERSHTPTWPQWQPEKPGASLAWVGGSNRAVSLAGRICVPPPAPPAREALISSQPAIGQNSPITGWLRGVASL